MSTHTPIIPSTLPLPADDAQDWANNTTAAIDSNLNNDPPTTDTPATQQSTVTSEKQLPGSFPSGPDTSATPFTGVVGTAQNALQNASETAKQYLPGSVSSYLHSANSPPDLPTKDAPSGSAVGAGSLPEPATESKGTPSAPKESTTSTGVLGTTQQSLNNAGQTAKQYLPKGVADLLPGAQAKGSEMPSTEVPSGSAVGVGSLPGTASEVSVAKLPEERRQEGLPSHETDQERLGKTGGVGPLPGGPEESKVALLPEERLHSEEEILGSTSGGAKHPITTTTNLLAAPIAAPVARPPTQAGASTANAVDRNRISEPPTPIGRGPGSGLGTAGLGAVTTSKPEEPKPEGKVQKVKEEVQDVKSKVTSALPGHNGPEHITGATGAPDTPAPHATTETSGAAAAAAAPAPQTTAGTDTGAVAAAGPTGAAASGERRASTGSAGAAHHKVGFLDKVRGEALIIQGKLGKNEKKIEEGRHLMGKE
ncbi:hypothetical protein Hypma_012931 [Hypsizygus marmoreus]|uniref:CsbD-like domain-containing protein n=1 Tax=Hypsizygus marmoreus TaxID=39966 RepID=A0A369JE65_HYPMA|nr:hypothetical protein Hypma_012931 [Hypsizygus marmoreus]